MTTLVVPPEVEAVFHQVRTCEFATLAKDNRPITWPTVALYGPTKGRFVGRRRAKPGGSRSPPRPVWPALVVGGQGPRSETGQASLPRRAIMARWLPGGVQADGGAKIRKLR
jgi:hypothetical protein